MSGGFGIKFSRGLSDKGAKMAGRTAEAEAPTDQEAGGTGRGKKLLLIVGPLLLAGVLAAGWFFFLKPSGPAQPKKSCTRRGLSSNSTRSRSTWPTVTS